MFKTQRQRREQRIRRLTDEQWLNLPEFLPLITSWLEVWDSRCDVPSPYGEQREELAQQIATDPEKREEYIIEWLNKAEGNSDDDQEFSRELDRFLKLRTEKERDNLLKVVRILIAVVALILAALKVFFF
jgi:hypothetical protein